MAAIAERVRRLARRFQRLVRCSACHLPRGTGCRLISGPGAYICESCIAAAAVPGVVGNPTARCSFCGRRDVPIARAWSDVAICAKCVQLSCAILAEDDRKSRPAT
jgi:ATP-dependent protease Clp ATPase subunit